MKKIISYLLIVLLITISSTIANAQISGIKNIPGDYATLAAAITDLNTVGVGAGGVTLNLIAANPQTSPAGGYVIGGTGSLIFSTSSASNQIIFEGNGNTITAPNPQPSGNVNDAIFKIIGGDYVTIQNFTMLENGLNTNIGSPAPTANNMTEFGVALFYESLTNGSQNNTIQNNTITLNRTNLNTFGFYSNTQHSASSMTTTAEVTAFSGSNSFNKVYGNTISNVNLGIYLVGAGLSAINVPAMDNGNDVGGSSLPTGNTITNVGGGIRVTAYVGTFTSSTWYIYESQQKNNNVSFNSITSAAGLQLNATKGAIFLNYVNGGGPTEAFTTTVNNNTVSISNSPTAGTGGGMIAIGNQASGTQITMHSGSVLSMSNNTVQNCIIGGTVSTNAGITAINSQVSYGTANINNNTIVNLQVNPTTTASSSIVGVSMGGSYNNVNIKTNIIRNLSSHAFGANGIGICFGINSVATVFESVTVEDNQLGNASGEFYSTARTDQQGTILHIQHANAAPFCNVLIKNNDFRNVVVPTGAITPLLVLNLFTGTQSYIVEGNTWTNFNLNNSGNVSLLASAVVTPVGGTTTYNNNRIVGTFARTANATSATVGITSTGTSAPGAIINMTNNNFSNVTIAGSGAFTGISNADGSAGANKTISGNTIYNISTSTGPITAITLSNGGGAGGNGNFVTGNIVRKMSGAGNVTGLDLSTGTTHTASLNMIDTLSSSGATSNVTGIAVGGATTTNVYSNTINTLSSSGIATPVVNGISVGSGTTANVYKNKIFGLSASALLTGATTITGMLFSGGTTVNAYNNLIGGLTAPAADMPDAIRGISVTSTSTFSTYNVHFNTVLISGSGGGTFGTSGIYHTASTTSTTAKLNLRNNIIVNNTVPSGAGDATAFRRSGSALANYGAASNNNLFYAGIPGINNLIYNDGTSPQQTLSAYKGLVVSRDGVSVTENPPFISTTGSSVDFLHIIASPTPTQVESGAVTISGITDDYDGNTRNVSTPDIGADEGTFTLSDLTGPSINYTLLANTLCATAPTLSATITDASGVNTTSPLNPRIWYRKGSNANTVTGTAPVDNTSATDGWKYVETLQTSSPYSFVINYSLLNGGVPVAGDVIHYFVVAQDGIPNLSINGGTFSAPQTSVALSAGISVSANNSYTIGSGVAASVTIGVSPSTYPTLTGLGGLFEAINAGGLSANTTATIVDAAITETGDNALNQITYGCAGTYTLTIVPAPGNTPTLSGSVAGPMINLNGADNVTFNGSNTGGTDLSMIIINTNTGGSTIQFINDATNNTVKNTVLRGVNASVVNGTVVFSTSTGTLGNSNNIIDNCFIRDGASLPANAVYSSGTTAAPNGSNTISGCKIFNFTNSGVLVAAAGAGNGWTINPTSFYHTANRTSTNINTIAILGGSGHSILNNNIGGSDENRGGAATTLVGSGASGSTTAGTFTGILLSVGTASPTSVQGNQISNLNITGNATAFTQIFNGIWVTSGNVNIGTVTGNIIGGGATLSDTIAASSDTRGIYNTGTGILNIENNVVGNLSYYRLTTDEMKGIRSNAGTNTIRNNIIRNLKSNSAAGGTFFLTGIHLVAATPGNIVDGNQVFNLNQTNPSGGAIFNMGMFIGSMFSGEVKKNKIYDIYATASCQLFGIYKVSGSATYSNNMISIIPASTTVSHGTVEGIRDDGTSGTNNWYFNSVHVGGSSASNNNSYAFRQINIAPVNIKNNIFSNIRTTTGTGINVAIAKTTATPTGWLASASNYNDLNASNIATIGLWGGTTSTPNFTRSLAGWQASQVAATSGSGGDANSFTFLPNFVNPAIGNLHIASAVASPLESAGVGGTGIIVDIDNQSRPGPAGSVNGGATAPDIGADEYDGFPGVAMTYVSSAVTQTNTSNVLTNTTNNQVIGIQIVTVGSTFPISATSFTIPTTGTTNLADIANAKLWYTGTSSTFGTSTQFGSTVAVPGATLTFNGSQTLAESINYFWLTYDVLCGATLTNVIDAECTSLTVSGAQTPSPTSVAGSRTIANGPLSGVKTVGTSGDYPTLTAAIAAVNAQGLSGNTTLSILNNLAESGEVSINQWTDCPAGSNFTLTIKPNTSGITVSTNSSTSVIKLNGADRVTIDGEVGSTVNSVCPAVSASRDMTIENTSGNTGSAIIWLTQVSTNGANNNTVKNCNIKGSGPLVTLLGISNSGAIGAPPTTPNNNNSFVNNNFSNLQIAFYSSGASFTNKNLNTVINQNLINTVAPNNVSRGGIFAQFEDGMIVSGNNISNIALTTTFNDVFGISLGLLVFNNNVFSGSECSNSTITYNTIGSIRHSNTASAVGIYLAPGTGGTSLIANNSVSGVSANGTANDFTAGMFITPIAGSVTNVYHNSVSMSGSQPGGDQNSYALAVSGGTGPTMNILNNLLVNTQDNGGPKFNYSIGWAYASFPNIISDRNLLFRAAGTRHHIGATGSLNSPVHQTLLSDWQSATTKDANSVSADPLMNTTTFLAVQPFSPALGAGANTTGITNDILCVTRSASAPPTGPTIGAYETAVDLGGPSITYTPLPNTISTANLTTSSFATITDPSGVNVAPGTNPRLYYKKTTDANTFAGNTNLDNGWKFVEANNAATPFDFTIIYSLLQSPVAALDTIEYFVVAQDLLSNVGLNSGIFAAAPTSVALTSTAFPLTGTINRYTILLSIPVTLQYCQNFDALPALGWNDVGISGTSGVVNNWVIGTPAKTQISAAYSAPNAYVTNLTGNYTSNQLSYVISPSFDFSTALIDPVLSFRQNFRTQADYDGGVLEVSTDGGTVWTKVDPTIGPSPDYISPNGSSAWYNNNSALSTTYTGGVTPPKWSNTFAGAGGSSSYNGHSNGWILSTTTLVGFAGQSNVQFRWRFTSDFGLTDEGWAIDDFCISIPPPPANDNAPGAILLSVGSGCSGASFTNLGATQSSGEPFAACQGTAGYNTVWFKFIAPPDGNVRVSTDLFGGTMGSDSRLALFSTETVGNYATFTNLACDDDNGGAVADKSILYATGLTPNNTYYIQVDGKNALTFRGTFCITVDEMTSTMLATSTGCVAGQPLTAFNNSYAGQVSVTDVNGKLVALISNAAPGLGTSTYDNAQHINVGPVREDPASFHKYLDRNYTINNASVTSANVQFFFLNSELTALQAADPGVTLATLQVTRQTGAVCDNDFVAANGTNSSLSALTGTGTGFSWLEVTTPGFSKHYIHAKKAYVPLKTFLQGAYSTALARHNNVTTAWRNILAANALTQPYNVAPFNYPGTENVTAASFTVTTPATDITDWVLVELRSSSNPATLVSSRAAFIREDGRIVDLNGSSPVSFGSGVPDGSYHIRIRHRNHLSIRTPNAIPKVLTSTMGKQATLKDFSILQDSAYQNLAITANPAQKNLAVGVFGMFGANATTGTDFVVKMTGLTSTNDYLTLLTFLNNSPANTVTNVYSRGDFNLDGTIKMTGLGNTNEYLFLLSVLNNNSALTITQHQ